MAMNTPLRASSCGRAGEPPSTNCGRKATKKIDSFGLSMLTSTPEVMTSRAERGVASSSTVSAPRSRKVAQAM